MNLGAINILRNHFWAHFSPPPPHRNHVIIWYTPPPPMIAQYIYGLDPRVCQIGVKAQKSLLRQNGWNFKCARGI